MDQHEGNRAEKALSMSLRFNTTGSKMSASFETILGSRTFKFIVGIDEVPFVIHETAVADQSRALATLMRGKMSESLAGEAKWKDVDRRTFIRFTQFAYTGDYSIPETVVKTSGQCLPLEDMVKEESLPLRIEPEPISEVDG